jgi:MGT family glycosyltransferase
VDQLPAVPTVYVTLGTVFNRDPALFAAILAGLHGEDLNVIVTLDPGSDPLVLGEQPANVHVERYIPLSLLLPHLDAMVTQGGTSILPALGHGLPLLVVPQAADQFHNAEACVAAGVALRLLPGELGPEAVRAAVRRLLDEPSFREGAARVRREIEAMPSPEACVPLVERLARTRIPLVQADGTRPSPDG